MNSPQSPLVVQYLYIHGQDEAFHYPSVRAHASAAAVALRYLECVLVQAGSLRLRGAECDLALATNLTDARTLGRRGVELMRRIESLGVRVVSAAYLHRPAGDVPNFAASRYLLDAVMAATEDQPPERPLLFTDVDCVWVDAERLFAAVPAEPDVGCIHCIYPPDWEMVGYGRIGRTPAAMGELAARLGGSGRLPPWIGGELFAGRPGPLRRMVATCEQLDAQLEAMGEMLQTEEQLLTLAGALEMVSFRDLSGLARRIWTGPRHGAPLIEDPLSLALWHLPSEKGLSLRRSARSLSSGRVRALRRDLAEPARMARRFNVAGNGVARRVRDDGWIAGRRAIALLAGARRLA